MNIDITDMENQYHVTASIRMVKGKDINNRSDLWIPIIEL